MTKNGDIPEKWLLTAKKRASKQTRNRWLESLKQREPLTIVCIFAIFLTVSCVCHLFVPVKHLFSCKLANVLVCWSYSHICYVKSGLYFFDSFNSQRRRVTFQGCLCKKKHTQDLKEKRQQKMTSSLRRISRVLLDSEGFCLETDPIVDRHDWEDKTLHLLHSLGHHYQMFLNWRSSRRRFNMERRLMLNQELRELKWLDKNIS